MGEDKSYIGSAILALIVVGMYLCFMSKKYKALEETENKFIFQIRPTISWAIGVFFGAIAFLFILTLLFFPPVTILTCKYSPESYVARQYPSCQLVAISWIGTEQNKTLISELQAALLKAKLDTDKDSTKLEHQYQIILITDKNNLLFRDDYIYKSIPEYKSLLTIASQVNSFITEPLQNSLRVEQNEKNLGYVGFGICVFFSLITLLILTVPPYITCSFDRESNLVTIKRCNLFGKKVLEDKISNIVGVEVETLMSEDITYRLTLMLASGEKLPLTYFFTSGGGQEEQFFANRIQKFLGIARNQTRQKV